MFKKFYLAVGIFLCIGLGTSFALGWKAPNLGIADSFSSGGSGGHSRGGFFYFGGMGGGGGFGK
jgi:hypothetical protein